MSKLFRALIHCECPHCNFIVELSLYGSEERFKNSIQAVECLGCSQFFVMKFSEDREISIFKCDTKKSKSRAFCTVTELKIPEVEA